ncbi:hypothetical protein NXX42_27130 [Bacteroides thetaiotaomicron]|nr:hypothetical protein [Bacteroides thetaiotaomicron]
MKNKSLKSLTAKGTDNSFFLASSILSGYYEIRAFTRWMLGFDEQTYFSRTFSCLPRLKGRKTGTQHYHLSAEPIDAATSGKRKRNSPFAFFREGGQLVKAVPTQVAFKAESSTEANVKMEGTICNANGNKIGTLQTLHDGMGRFEYTPDEKSAIAK